MRRGGRFGRSPRGPESERTRLRERVRVRLRYELRPSSARPRLVRELTCLGCGAWFEVIRMGVWVCSLECARRHRKVS